MGSATSGGQSQAVCALFLMVPRWLRHLQLLGACPRARLKVHTSHRSKLPLENVLETLSTSPTSMSWAAPLQDVFFFFRKLENCYLLKWRGFVSEAGREMGFEYLSAVSATDLHDPSFLLAPVMRN